VKFIELANVRRSVRGYDPRAVPEELLKSVLEAGRLAPSAANRQPWHFVVVTDPEVRKRVAHAYPRDWFASAPIVIVLCVEPRRAWRRSDGKNYCDVDGAIAMDHITLCAADFGLGTCWIAAFEPEKLRQALELPPEVEPLAMTPLGYPADHPTPKKRKPLEKVVHWEKW